MARHFLRTLSAAGLACALLSGCATATFQFVSDPEGAVVRTSAGSAVLGTTPFGFSVDKDSLAAYATTPGCYQLPAGYEATWGSGAKAATESPLTLCSPGSDDPLFRIQFDRPKDAPGLEDDLKTALRNAQTRAATEAARAAAAQRELDMQMGFGWGWGPFMAPPPPLRGHRPPPPPPPRPPRPHR